MTRVDFCLCCSLRENAAPDQTSSARSERMQEPIIRIATEEERAWQRFRCAVLARLNDRNPTTDRAVAETKAAYLRAAGASQT